MVSLILIAMAIKRKKKWIGGRRPGAGRKFKGHVRVQLHMPREGLAALDALRGDTPRGQWISELVLEELLRRRQAAKEARAARKTAKPK